MTDAKHITRSTSPARRRPRKSRPPVGVGAQGAASNVDWDSRFRAISRNPATADFGADSAAYSVVKDTAKVGATVVNWAIRLAGLGLTFWFGTKLFSLTERALPPKEERRLRHRYEDEDEDELALRRRRPRLGY